MAYDKRSVISQIFGAVGLTFLFLGALGLGFGAAGFYLIRSGQEFARDGVTVTGHVERLWETTSTCKDSGSNTTHTCTVFHAGYGYPVDGKVVHAEMSPDYTTWANLSEGAPIQVRYLPRDPTDNTTSFSADSVDATGGMSMAGLFAEGMAAFFVLLGAGGITWLVRRAQGAAWMRDNGTQRGAVVTAKEQTNISVNNRTLYRIRWKDDAGETGASRARSPETLPEAGSRITIYADPAGKRPAVWEGDCGTR